MTMKVGEIIIFSYLLQKYFLEPHEPLDSIRHLRLKSTKVYFPL